MAYFDTCQDFVFRWEGGLSDDPEDKGGLTKYGVCWEYIKDLERTRPSVVRDILGVETVTRSVLKSLSKRQAAQFFKFSFWDPYKLDEMPQSVALCWYDMNVNHGPANAARILQRACNRIDSLQPRLDVDGKPGPKTRAALRHMNNHQGIDAIFTERQAFYDRIVANNPKQKVFLRGWTNRCMDMRQQAFAWLEDE